MSRTNASVAAAAPVTTVARTGVPNRSLTSARASGSSRSRPSTTSSRDWPSRPVMVLVTMPAEGTSGGGMHDAGVRARGDGHRKKQQCLTGPAQADTRKSKRPPSTAPRDTTLAAQAMPACKGCQARKAVTPLCTTPDSTAQRRRGLPAHAALNHAACQHERYIRPPAGHLPAERRR